MKSLKIYIPVIALLSLAACKKSFLDTEDVTSATEQNFYKTQSDAYKALVGVYDGLQRTGSSGSGLAVSWNFDAPLFRNARNVTLEIEDGAERRKIPLDNSQRANTLFYAPRETDVTLRLQIQPEGAAEPAKTEVIRLGTQNAQPVVAQ